MMINTLASNSNDYDRPKKAGFIKKRFVVALLATFCPIVCYISRQNLSLAIVAMVNNNQTLESTNQAGTSPSPTINATINATAVPFAETIERHPYDTCPIEGALNDEGLPTGAALPLAAVYGPKFNWTASEKSLCFEAFFWTYVFCQIPGARLSEKIGAKWILTAATLGSSLVSLLSPLAASYHVYAFALLRAIMGVCQAALFPACIVLVTRWLPPFERSLALPILCVGAFVGSIISSISTGYFSEQPSLGWQYAFYMPSALCALWTLIWIAVGTSEPHQDKSISLEELEYIESRMEKLRTQNSVRRPASQTTNCPINATPKSTSTETSTIETAATATPKEISWTKLFTSQHIWAMMMAFFASNWSFTIVLLLVPSYLNDILHISPMKNGTINSVIYFLYCVASPLVGSISTMMVETRAFGLSRLNIRKLFQCTALFGQAACFVAISLLGCDETAVLAVLFSQIILFSFVNGGEVQLPSDMSVDFAGTIYAIGNCVGSSTGFIVPRVHSLLVYNSLDRSQWSLYFYIAASVCAFGGAIFALFGRNEQRDFSKTISESQMDICGASLDGNGNGPASIKTITPPSRGACFELDLSHSQQTQKPSRFGKSPFAIGRPRQDLETPQ